jgi:hypothetical protein
MESIGEMRKRGVRWEREYTWAGGMGLINWELRIYLLRPCNQSTKDIEYVGISILME